MLEDAVLSPISDNAFNRTHGASVWLSLVFQKFAQTSFFSYMFFLMQALTGCIVDVPTLDERLISIPINDIVR